jgi:phosphohistidine phosphatase
MHLYMLRHGEAGSHVMGKDDSLRPLTDEGKAKLRIQAATLHGWNIKFGAILSSPYIRARQTADIIAEAYGLPVQEDKRLSSGVFDSSELSQLLREYADARLLITGHEPDFSSVLSSLIGGGRFDFVKGGLAHITIDNPHNAMGTLQWFLTPALMGAR